ncbi:SMC-Scp complex subunit ScpB [Verrucomicrobium sp. BvORR106]|uniref:SMC-Scp complex subunit ScpB n=1 Tax=Verrucomicrobium sp. BvORR106 TaxID=1403819 RepID=UPI00068E4105|nr:SMC-Scp complex subunit ScpB [Verrucomicrobium sp. BvORR106]
MDLTRIVEALLFATQEPLSVVEMGRAIRETAREAKEVAQDSNVEPDEQKVAMEAITDDQVREALAQLVAHYEQDGRSFTIIERTAGWRLCARGEFGEWCRALYPGKKPARLSAPALETLAIIAYRQPITKSAIEAVRGVSVDAMVQQLLDRNLLKVDGRADLPGRPLLFSTTDLFLDHFGIRHLDDLPNAAELRRVKLPTPEETVESPSPEQAEAKEKEKKAENAMELGL